MTDNMLTFAIGDMHGHIDKLDDLLERCKRYRGDRNFRLVFLGDYIDRGPKSRYVVDRLIDLQQRMPGGVICLRGNHEAALLDLVRGEYDMKTWLSIGGGERTLESYGVQHVSEF